MNYRRWDIFTGIDPAIFVSGITKFEGLPLFLHLPYSVRYTSAGIAVLPVPKNLINVRLYNNPKKHQKKSKKYPILITWFPSEKGQFKTFAMSFSPSVNTATIQQWIADKLNIDTIQEHLVALGHDEESIAIHLKEFKKVKYAKRQFTGFIFMGIGSMIGFISCILSILNPVPELYGAILYGLTSIAITIAFIGLYYVLE
ncbi:hypothetical protein BC349_11595 [Flavihumibacter stibioxidans]|uniref:Uncharacterized protein n=2 Tax=Flavihumibacter stibioxidans TaxID=1834163 RepID=A0ABR7M9U1_9BACT|nr:hypothetical protein [Flavihumibacter stibioxidans]